MALVLLVEDDADLRSILLQSLPFFGTFEVVGACDGIEGLEMCAQLMPACMVVDVKMPGLDGYQLVRVLRGDPSTSAIPLIILTALPQDEARFGGLASGADRFLQKPTKPRDLARVIDEVLHITQEERIQKYRAIAESMEDIHE